MARRDTLARLKSANPTAVFLLTALLVIAALLLPGPIGGVFLLVLSAGLVLLLLRTWPHHQGPARTLRLAVLVLLVILAVLRLAGVDWRS